MKPAAPMSAPPPDEDDDRAGKKPRSLVWKVIAITTGTTLIILGIAGLALPILQGWLMIFAGLAVLSPYSRRARRITSFLKEKLRFLRKQERRK